MERERTFTLFGKCYLLLFFILVSMQAYSSHIVGGELSYDCLGGNNYRITLKLYRDCSNPANALFPSYPELQVWDSKGNYLGMLLMTLPPIDTVKNSVIN